VPDDTNEESDVFVFDITTSQMTRHSHGFDGSQANDRSGASVVSSDGHYVAFVSEASNLTPGDVNKTGDPFLLDRESGQTIRIPDAGQLDGLAPSWPTGVSISADGRLIAFIGNFRPPVGDVDAQVFMFDRVVGETRAVSLTPEGKFANDRAGRAAVSPNGRIVAFTSYATDLTHDDTRGKENVFLHELSSGDTKCISCMPDAPRIGGGAHGGATFSGDGRYLAYQSDWYGGIAIFDIELNAYLPPLDLRCNCRQATSPPSLSLDGNLVVFEAWVDRPLTISEGWFEGLCTECGVSAAQAVIFLHNRISGVTTRIFPVDELTSRSKVNAGHPDISPDGRYVAFDNLVSFSKDGSLPVKDIIIYDRETGESMIVTAGNGVFEWSR
jgi:Tol biopolymer transport system component